MHQGTSKDGHYTPLWDHLFQWLKVLIVEASLVAGHVCCPLSPQRVPGSVSLMSLPFVAGCGRGGAFPVEILVLWTGSQHS